MGLLALGSTPRPDGRSGAGRHGGDPAGSPPASRGLDLFLAFLEKDLLFRLIGVLLLSTLVPLGEIFLFIFLARLLGNFLVLAIAVAAGIAGALVAMEQARRAWAKLKRRAASGRDVGTEMVELAGILLGAVLLITPGFVTDLCGFALFVPRVRTWAGRGVARLLAAGLGELSGRGPLTYSLKIR